MGEAANEIKALATDLASTWEHTKAAFEQQDAEIKKFGEAAGETKQAVERLNDRLDEIEVKMSRPGVVDGASGPDETRAAFTDFLRKGATPDNAKALSRGIDTAGGYLVPEGVASELVANLVEVSPIREIADVRVITEGASYPYVRRTSEAAATWTSEQGTRSETTNPAFGAGRIPLHEMSLSIDISRQLLDMANFDVEGEWMDEAVEQAAKLEGAAFVAGNGASRPQGFTHANAGLQSSYTASGAAADLGVDALLAMPLDLKGGYLPNCKWVMNRATLKVVRKLKDGNGQYLWSASFGNTLAGGLPATIDEYPYIIAQDMPDIAANAFPIAFGDFKQGYKIVDHVKMHQIRDEATQAASGNVRFWVTRYVGGQVVKTEAIRLMKCATS